MRIIRGAILAIVVAFGLVAATASTAYADDGWPNAAATTPSGGATSSTVDPGDPGLPPD